MNSRAGIGRSRTNPSPAAAELAAFDPRDYYPRALLRRFRTHSLGFQLACLYMFFEYFRPQTRFPALDVLPWTMLIVLAGFAAMIPEASRKGWTKSPVNAWLGVYFLVAAVSLVFSDFPAFGLSKWNSLVPWLVIFVFLANTVTSRDRFMMIALVYLACNLKFSLFGLRVFVLGGLSFPGHGIRGPTGWFANQGELGVQMAMMTPLTLMIALGLWHQFGRIGRSVLLLVPFSTFLTTIGTHSRGAILALAAGVGWALLAFGVKLRTLVAVAIVAALGVSLIGENTWDRFQAMGDDTTSQRRLTFIEDGLEMMSQYPVLGIGYFNWMPYYIANYPPVDDIGHLGGHQLPHNILIQAGAELGMAGLLVFLVLFLLSFAINRRTRALLGPEDRLWRLVSHGLDAAMVVFFIAGQFVTILYYPYFWIHLTLTVALHESCRRDLGPVRRVRGRLRQAASTNGNGIVPEPTVHARRAKGP